MSRAQNSIEAIFSHQLPIKQLHCPSPIPYQNISEENSSSLKIQPLLESQTYNLKTCQEKAPELQQKEKTSRGQEWSLKEEALLLQLHNQKGNRWVEIARQLNRNDNFVKNHYHSKLRKTLRKINKALSDHSISPRQLKNSLISKIIQTAQELYSRNPPQAPSLPHSALELKNLILDFSSLDEQSITQEQERSLKTLVAKIDIFSNGLKEISKREPKSNNSRYKGKQIISLLSQNQKSTVPPPPKTRRSLSFISEVEEEEQPYSHDIPSVPNPYFGYEGLFPLPYFYPLYQPTPFIFSGRQSSFSSYNGDEADWGSTRVLGESSSERHKQSLW